MITGRPDIRGGRIKINNEESPMSERAMINFRCVNAVVVIVAAVVIALPLAAAERKVAPASEAKTEKDAKAMVTKLPARVTVEAGQSERNDTPVCVGLGQSLGGKQIRVEEIKGAKRVPVAAQEESGGAARLWWILAGKTAAGAKRVYELTEAKGAAGEGVDVKLDDKALEISLGKAKVLRYNHAVMPPPKGANKKYSRSAFIHPLWSPAGAVLTEIHPKDHLHHMGLWNPWTKTKFEGRDVDFWNLGAGKGTVRFAKFASTTAGSVFGEFRALQEHVDLSAPSGEKVALNEQVDVRVWNVGGPKKGFWLVDFTTTQRCASSSPLLLAKYRYGGFGFRGTSQWKEGNSDYLTSEGKTRKDGHGTRAKWCIVHGTTAKGPAGVLFMSHPKNRSHPEPMRIWPKGDIFFNFCPIQKKAWTLEPGNDYVLRYRLYVFSGKLTAKAAEGLWQDIADPPTVTVGAVPAK